MDDDATKIERFLNLFGLDPGFTPDELAGAYRALAKLNHPDVSADVESEMRMVLINEGYRFLRDKQREGAIPVRPERAAGARKEDPCYAQYKRAFLILKSAFEDYFGENPDKSRTGKTGVLKERLSLAKEEFSRLVTDLPYSEWVDDAIDKINSINKWLGNPPA